MACLSPVVWVAVAFAAALSMARPQAAAFPILDSCGKVSTMIVLLHPRATEPKNRRFPLAALAIAAVIEGKEEYTIVDGNIDNDPGGSMDRIVRASGAEMLAVSVMPGPQMAAAIPLCKEFRKKYPKVPIVW